MPKKYLNPTSLFPSQQYGFSQGVSSRGGTMIFLSGQVAWDENQQIVGHNDLRAQTWQTLKNMDIAMQAAGGTLADVVSMRIFIVEEMLDQGHHISEALKAHFSEAQAPATTWIGVRSLADKEFLIEIEAIAVIEEGMVA
jgi:enamine deaminase RidA (YjgF/YER057c/UK114 family)